VNVIGIVRIAMLAGREFLIQEGDVPQAHIHLSFSKTPSGNYTSRPHARLIS
jgi:hypothetical protein